MDSHFGINFILLASKTAIYVIQKIILIIIANTPNVIIISFKKGTCNNSVVFVFTGFLCSIHLKKTNNKKAILQIKANFDKKRINLIPKKEIKI